MKVIFLIAWRNIWRNKLRSFVVIFAIMLGIWAGIFVLGLSFGLNEQRLADVIHYTTSHVQIHAPAYLEEGNIKSTLENYDKLTADLSADQKVKSWAPRIKVTGTAASPKGTAGVMITGIDPEMEKALTALDTKLVEGEFFEGMKRNPILIGKALADKLGLGIRSKMVVNFQNDRGELSSAAFRVVGIYQSLSSRFDKIFLYVRASDLQSQLVNQQSWHEIALLVENEDSLFAYADNLAVKYPEDSIRTWRQVAPDLAYADDTMAVSLGVVMGIILFALMFGIINTMLMAVLERKRELGMLLSVGMNKTRVFSMILLETLFLGSLGGPIGLFLSWLTIYLTHKNGLTLSGVDEGMAAVGMSSTIYPALEPFWYFFTAGGVVLIAFLSALYPGYKAVSLKPAEAVRAI